MKKALQIIRVGVIHILLYIAFAFLILVLFALTGTKDANGVTKLSDFAVLTVLIVPIVIIWVLIRIVKAKVKSKNALKPIITTSMESVDRMNGHEFEYFCANLLSKNGFTDVEVTKESGDQGVDILAEKEGIRYAIQCKCYSSDLGNKPVQEVFAGKSIYNCHIAAVLTNRSFTQGGMEAARATGVLLWDRKKLQAFIDNAEQQKTNLKENSISNRHPRFRNLHQ